MTCSKEGKIFFCELSTGHSFKSMIDSLELQLTKTEMRITEDGIFIRDADPNLSILFDNELLRENFKGTYICKKEQHFKICTKTLHKLIKNVKKKDTMFIYIDKNSPKELCFGIRPSKISEKDSNSSVYTSSQGIETFSVAISHIDPKEKAAGIIMLPGDTNDEEGYIIDRQQEVYGHPVVIESSYFQKVKKLVSLGKIIEVEIQGTNYISFYTDKGTVCKNKLECGTLNEKEPVYCVQFTKELFSVLIKMATLSSQMQFYSPKIEGTYPLKVRTQIGGSNHCIGYSNVYIKDRDMIAATDTQES